jgi:hypothetical protein
VSAPTDFVYNNARSLFATGQLDWETAPIGCALLNTLYIPSVSDVFLSTVIASGAVIITADLTSTTQVNGICRGVIPIFNSLTNPVPAAAMLLYEDTGDPATSTLIYYSSGGPGFPMLLQGLNYYIGYDALNGGWFQV